jgi:hypothetical protein
LVPLPSSWPTTATALLTEGLTGLVPPETRRQITFATSLRPAMARPFLLVLTGTSG